MGEKGQAYRRRKQARRDAEVEKIKGMIWAAVKSPKLLEVAEWIDAHPGEDPELERRVQEILDALRRLLKDWRAAERRYEKRRARLKVVK